MTDYLFSGLRVIDCASVIAAPAAAMILADYGADVIKIEEPIGGDMLRLLSHIQSTPEAGNDWFWQLDGRNKRGMTLDLKTTEGQQLLGQLVAGCDVFITNQPLDVRESLNLTYEALSPLNERMIYASLTAYGEEGPERDRRGFDQLAYWARSGLMDLMREPGTRPTQGLPGMGDHPTGVALYAAIVTALLQRERTGKGGLVSTSLLANGLWSVAGVAAGAFAGGDMTAFRAANEHYSAMHRPYQCADGRWLQFNMVRNEELLSLLLTGLEAVHLLADPRFQTLEDMFVNRQAFGDEIAQLVFRRTSQEWLEVFAELDVPVNRIGVVEELLDDAQVRANRMAVDAQDTLGVPRTIRHPLSISSVPSVPMRRGPGLGEHNDEIVEELNAQQTEGE